MSIGTQICFGLRQQIGQGGLLVQVLARVAQVSPDEPLHTQSPIRLANQNQAALWSHAVPRKSTLREALAESRKNGLASRPLGSGLRSVSIAFSPA